MKRLMFFFLLFSTASSLAKPVGKASFHAIAEGLALDIQGEGAIVEGSAGKEGFSVKLSEFKTGLTLRDKHFCKVLECMKYPTARLILAPGFQMKDGDNTFMGTLELHGVKKPFVGQASIKGASVYAIGKILLTDYGIKPPEYKLAKVSNEVDIMVELEL